VSGEDLVVIKSQKMINIFGVSLKRCRRKYFFTIWL